MANPNPNPNPIENQANNPPNLNPNPNPNQNLLDPDLDSMAWYIDRRYDSQSLKEKVLHIMESVNHLKDVAKALELSMNHAVSTRYDPAKTLDDLKAVRNLINKHYGDLIALLLQDAGSSCIVSGAHSDSDIDLDILNAVASTILAKDEKVKEEEASGSSNTNCRCSNSKNQEKEAGKNESGEEGNLLQTLGRWLMQRAEVCAREVSGFCDIWSAITTILVLVNVVEHFSSLDLGEVATRHNALLGLLFKDHRIFFQK